MRGTFAVECECGRQTPVSPQQMGGKVPCGCSQVVVVPLQQEFETQPVLKTSTTVERRITRLHDAGELIGETCCCCGTRANADLVTVEVSCDRARLHESGDPPSIFALWPPPPMRQSTDHVVKVPFRICTECRAGLRGFVWWPYLIVVILITALPVLTQRFFQVPDWARIPAGALFFICFLYANGINNRLYQRRQRDMLARVPALAHLLRQYRAARVDFPPAK